MQDGLIRVDEVLRDQLSPARTRRLDMTYGNYDLLEGLDLLGVAGPFKVVSPWELEDEHGVRRINASGYAALPFGDQHPELVAFIREFLDRNTTTGLPQQSVSAWRAALQANLVRLLSSHLPSHADSRVFFSSSGTEAIEGAVKFAKAARPKGRYFVSFKSGYHGKTFMSLSLTPNPEYQDLFRPLVPGVENVPYGDLEVLRHRIRMLGPDRIVAVVIEPIQGEGGVNIPPPGYLKAVGDLCREHGIIVIADEIQTGLGRTGHWFESAAQGLDPDIITLAKPLGGGMVPIGATIVRREIFQKMLHGLASKRHSNTFGGNSLAMAVGMKSLEMLVEQDLPARSLRMGEQGLARLREIQRRHPGLLSEVRAQGMLFAMQFHPMIGLSRPKPAQELLFEATAVLGLRELHRAGVQVNLSLSSKRTLRLTPALNVPDELFEEMWRRVETAASRNHRSWRILTNTPAATTVRLASFAIAKG
ncbi:aspartate aminotransferase family protein [Deinococcus pimensis]|uniref:aspartate aminotransferase family protein n=1 Tax=Deinococcus pimensis TaxID=309888 RepID=UPI000483C25E|nr:aminotransferase class III-fold pyridoxal phosphate-dependent enzyme [Deinococcus pimensis]